MNITKFTKAYNVGILQGKAYRVFQNHLSSVLEPYNLTIPEWKIIGLLYDNKEMKAVDLASYLDIDAPLVTVLNKALEKKGFIKRKKSKDDKRAVVICITEKANKIIPEIENVARQEFKQILKGVNAIELAIYIRVLEVVVKQGKAHKVKKNYLID